MSSRSDKDLQLWKEYKRAKDAGNDFMAKQKARELYKQMKGVIHNKTNSYRNYGIPMVAVESEGRKAFKEAIDRYDPSYGTQLSTFVTNYLKSVGNYVKNYKDVARIPQNRATQIDNYTKTKDDLEIRKGREPNASEMADAMNWDLAEVKRMENELRKELTGSNLRESGLSIDLADDPKTMDTLMMVYQTLTGEEKLIFEYLTGFSGKPKLDSAKQVANAVGVSPATVSRRRKSLMKKIKKYL
jgi:DNA-directed RNA polymerase specialized sigma subunit